MQGQVANPLAGGGEQGICQYRFSQRRGELVSSAWLFKALNQRDVVQRCVKESLFHTQIEQCGPLAHEMKAKYRL